MPCTSCACTYTCRTAPMYPRIRALRIAYYLGLCYTIGRPFWNPARPAHDRIEAAASTPSAGILFWPKTCLLMPVPFPSPPDFGSASLSHALPPGLKGEMVDKKGNVSGASSACPHKPQWCSHHTPHRHRRFVVGRGHVSHTAPGWSKLYSRMTQKDCEKYLPDPESNS